MDLKKLLRQQLAALDLVVDAAAEEQLLLLLHELLRWNRTHNLTAIDEPAAAVEKHLVDSLTLLPYIGEGADLLDIGSGAGFPGLPLKVARRSLSIVSVDSVGKKINFQKHMVRKLQLEQFFAWHGRAEDLPGQPFAAARFDYVVARAFASIPKLLELALPCLRPAGKVIAMKGPEGGREVEQAGDWLRDHGLECLQVISLALPASGAVRQLLIFGR